MNPSTNKTPSNEEAPEIEPKAHKSKLWLKITGVAGLVLLIVILSSMLWFLMGLSSIRSDISVDGQVVVVEPNSGIDSIANNLSEKNLISNKLVFVLYARLGPARGQLKPGPYLIKPTSSIKQIVDSMAAGKTAINKITYPEGITIEDMAKRYQAAGYGTKQQYQDAVKAVAPEFDFIPVQALGNPEGFLFPATYVFPVNSPAEVLVRKQYEAYRDNALPLLEGNLPGGLDQYETLTLASIVEKEALTVTDRKLVAGVFLNRLAVGMKLESDVTVNYITGRAKTLAEDLKIDTAYNSYFYKGLPPTPINNPSTDAIKATLEPTDSEYLFFLAGNDGKVYYANTLQEHNENIKNHL
ncbi:MAG TPA: endolytic transglycosylase MltG [Candidatus Saccharibacteria bacterium]|nr:endolytic transglycosylase MltG [Candidatus Saccharibacteria bacterium]HMT39431.1 endolytic transglycosylase MltG [Candidatus Saccharibacteria bacterium]